ncbi:hypothetical protein KM043_014984 [Ampulex compressa]|nr:hypothetical protein KM043_014984 [Ampulex compressa]
MPNRRWATPQGVYYMLPYYMQATGPRRTGADFMGLWHEAFIPDVEALPDILYAFMVDKGYDELKMRQSSGLSGDTRDFWAHALFRASPTAFGPFDFSFASQEQRDRKKGKFPVVWYPPGPVDPDRKNGTDGHCQVNQTHCRY